MSLLGLREAAILLVSLSALLYRYRIRRKSLSLPPGPPRLPFVGNALSIPTHYPQKYYKRLGDQFGSKILYLEAFGQPIVVLNSAKAGKDLLDRRSATYSSRPHMTMFLEMPRRIFAHMSGVVSEVSSWRYLMAYGFVASMIQSSSSLKRRFDIVTSAVAPGRFLVDVFPTLKHVPEWMPGAGFKSLARKWRQTVVQMAEDSYAATLQTLNNGTALTSFLSENMALQNEGPDEEISLNDLKRVAQQVYGAGFETTSVALITFILAMLLYPDIQRRVQQELDSVVSTNRLPDFSDQPNLPYLSAVLKEVFRWNTPVPLGVPRASTEDDIYEGYFIPKVLCFMMKSFSPTPRYSILKDGKLMTDIPLDPAESVSFGFGRRICPGIHLVHPILFLAAASILTLFDIVPEFDSDGNPIKVTPQFNSDSLTSEPLPFKCKFAPHDGRPIEHLLKEYLSADMI
ncbi:hypothetical protein NP233_g5089 [Leucocoprinus birnbaumii]|uniref:Cytochrome P450 n=1 Tax=Leucocoprinus birnbaumii TaxID=56174 RepID=A0AAD5YX15_9AGAR|nr:hypothetical protein NP233_g5089 [Leucocoprinus birnbaumii]